MDEPTKKYPAFYEGKASRLYETDEPELLVIERKDDVTKLDGAERTHIEGKGAYTNRISNWLFSLLQDCGIPTHFVCPLNSNETLIRRTEPIKLEVIVRNIATGSLCKRLPFKEGTKLDPPLVEFDYKDDSYHDPLINTAHAIHLGIATEEELGTIELLAQMTNLALRSFFKKVGITLVDFKLEFGRTSKGEIILIDEISPDTCRFWDANTGQSLDKDIFRKGGSNDKTLAAYQEIFDRITADR